MADICPFCREGIRESVFARSDHFQAIYNIAPVLPGHSLIIPADHIESILSLPQDQKYEMMAFAEAVTRLLLGVYNTEAFNWSLQEKYEAGQTIDHLHWHIVPRISGDFPDPGDWYPHIVQNDGQVLDSTRRKKLTHEEMQQVISRLRKEAKDRGLYPRDSSIP